MTTERITQNPNNGGMGQSSGTTDTILPPPEVIQTAGREALSTPTATQPFGVTGPEHLVHFKGTDQAGEDHTGVRQLIRKARTHGPRLAFFAMNGMNVFVAGLLIQVLLVQYAGMSHVSSYIVQTIASVQMSFLFSWFLTRADRGMPFRPTLVRFNIQRFAVTGLGMAGYAGLERFGMNYLAANVAVTAVLTPVSFLSSQLWSMTEPRTRPVIGSKSTTYSTVRDLTSVPWALFAVLGVQAILSLRLIWSNTAFLDEATYIWAGRIELWHLTTGTSVPAYSTYLSGAPVIYPPLAGLADIIGGLVAARLLSLTFMLGATCMLWGSAKRLFGQRAALAAVAFYVSISSTQDLGSLATYDAMALFLLSLSGWLIIVARNRADSTWLLIGGIAALVLANATKYATGLFDPVIVTLAVLTTPHGLKAGIGRGGLILGCTVGAIGGLLAVAGPWYVAGLQFTTLTRAPGDQSPGFVLMDAVRWIGVVIAVAIVAIATAWWRDRKQTTLISLLTVAGFLTPLNQARIHTTVSLVKHVDFGAWFACIAAGYAIAALTRVGRYRWVHMTPVLLVSVAIIGPFGGVGRAQGYDFIQGWPNATQVSHELRLLIRSHPGMQLAEDYDVPGYYLENQVPWQNWANTWYFQYRPPGTLACIGGSAASASGQPAPAASEAFDRAVANRYFSLIILDFGDTIGIDGTITAAMSRDRTYHVIAELPYSDVHGKGQYTIWAPTATSEKVDHGSSC